MASAGHTFGLNFPLIFNIQDRESHGGFVPLAGTEEIGWGSVGRKKKTYVSVDLLSLVHWQRTNAKITIDNSFFFTETFQNRV